MGRLIAVIIGCNYQDVSGEQRLSVLRGAEQDALNIATLLVERPIQNGRLGGLTLLLGAQVTKSSIESAIQNAKQAVQTREDTLLFYFSGHGGDGPDGLILYTSDGEYSGDQLVKQVGWPEYQMAFIFDCCHAADFRESKSGALPDVRLRVPSAPGGQASASASTTESLPFQALYAALVDQQALEEGEQGRFTSALIEALTQERTPPLLALPLQFEAWKAALPVDLSERRLQVSAGRDALSLVDAAELTGEREYAQKQNVAMNAPPPMEEDSSAISTSTLPLQQEPPDSLEEISLRDVLDQNSQEEDQDSFEMQNPAAQTGFRP